MRFTTPSEVYFGTIVDPTRYSGDVVHITMDGVQATFTPEQARDFASGLVRHANEAQKNNKKAQAAANKKLRAATKTTTKKKGAR